MKNSEEEIIELFRSQPNNEFSTYEIISKLYPDEVTEISNMMNVISDKETVQKAKRKKAQLHRKILYYLNKLIEDEILKITKEGRKGIKYYSVALEEGEELILRKKKRKIIIQKPNLPAMPIEGYEQQNLLLKYEPATWINRVNSIILETRKFSSFKELNDAIQACFANINDTVALNDFETFLKNAEEDNHQNFIKKYKQETDDYGKNMTIILDITNLKDKDKVLNFLYVYTKIKPRHITVIFDTRLNELNNNIEFFKEVIELFYNRKIKLYIKNQDLYDAPYFIGRAGPYTIDPDEWKIYKRQYQDKMAGLVCSMSSVGIDMNRFLTEYKDFNQFREVIMKIAKALLFANSLQRRKSEEYFREIMKISDVYTKEFFYFSKNYIRFWNYGWKEKPETYYFDLLKNTKEIIDNFCSSEETIYLSCGMPMRYKIAFSCSFSAFVKDKFTKKKFPPLQINKVEDFYSKEVKEMLEEKEKIFEIFDGGDRLRIKRSGDINANDICREFGIIINTYKIPFFCYDFDVIKSGNLKLTSFIK